MNPRDPGNPVLYPGTPVLTDTFRHEALLYAGEDGLVDGLLPFLSEGIEAGEPTLVVLDAGKIARLKSALGAAADQVQFADMAVVGANPGRIIPAWREFADAHPNQPLRGVGEPIWAARPSAEMAECHRHEALLNVAFADRPGFWLVCPYDLETLDPMDVERACFTHPHVSEGGAERASGYPGLDAHAAPFTEPLPAPPVEPVTLSFDADSLGVLRRFVADRAARAGLDSSRVEDLLLAVNEVAGNSVRHGGGEGVLEIWQDEKAVLCEVRDGGQIERPLVGRERPVTGQVGGYGLWLANQLCDLVQVRSFPLGSSVRLHMRVT
jgi:anti-sigma regulatory factor (Ser/Thr protein kinase)